MKKNFKALIRDRYKGRGNCWVKIPKESEAYEKALKIIEFQESTDFIGHIEREGFAWMRFSKPSGVESDPRCLFEIRYKGSKIDHPDCILDLPDAIAETLPLLGNTPVKLQLETDPSMRKEKAKKQSNPKKRKNKSYNLKNSEFESETSVEDKVQIIQEAVLTRPTSSELKEWENFLRAEGILEFSI